MLIRAKPTSPGRRAVIGAKFSHLSKKAPCKSLLRQKTRISGRNNKGRMTVRRRGGGHKRRYRIIDFKRDKCDISGTVVRLEYDPNRSAHIALILYSDGERRYILAPKGLVVGDTVISGEEVPIKPGNCMPITHIPIGSVIHAIEMRPGKGAQIARSAGVYAQLMARVEDYASVRLRSGEIRRIPITCRACIGEVSNADYMHHSLGKAGASRWRGRRPTVRGVAMNPIDHPLGGGEGRSSGGRHPVSAYGVPAKGYRTRRNKRTSGLIVQRRYAKKDKRG